MPTDIFLPRVVLPAILLQPHLPLLTPTLTPTLAL